MWQIASEFADIPVRREEKVKVGIVGEIYMKYSPLGNNNLEAFLQQEDVEIEIPGLMDFVIYTCDNTATDTKLYGMKIKNYLGRILKARPFPVLDLSQARIPESILDIPFL